MWVFKSKVRKGAYLAANPKVLTQTLLKQKKIERFISRKRYLHFLQKELSIGLGPEYIMLVRNPFNRVESYFKEKLRQKVYRVLDKNNPYILKRHQTIFYPYLGIDEQDSLKKKSESLLALDFKSFVSKIPDLYKLEDHLSPQTYNFTRNIGGISRVFKMDQYVHLENKNELEWLAGYFELDLSKKSNSTDEIKEEIHWNQECIDIVRNVYSNDFEVFGYAQNPPNRH